MFDFERFDYETKRAIYSECEQTNCPNLEIKFISEFLKRDYTVVFVTLNQPCAKIQHSFDQEVLKKYQKLIFVDCIGNKDKKIDKNIYLKDKPLEERKEAIENIWKNTHGKKILFFDCAELLFKKYEEREAFNLIHEMLQQFQIDGIVVFCFLKQSLNQQLEHLIRHLFDQSIFL